MAKLKLVPAAFDPKQADIKEEANHGKDESTDESKREREYAGRIENASERFHTPVLTTEEQEKEAQEERELAELLQKRKNIVSRK